MEWMTNRDINEWERKRRQVKIKDIEVSEKNFYRFSSDKKLSDATLLFLVPDGISNLRISKDGVSLEWRKKNIYGFDWAEVVFDMEGEEVIGIECGF